MSKTVRIFDFEESPTGVGLVIVRTPISGDAMTASDVDIEVAHLKADLDAVAIRMKAALARRAHEQRRFQRTVDGPGT